MFKLIFSFALLFSTSSFAQKHELSLGYRFGLDHGSKNNSNTVLSSSYDQGVTLQFKYRIWSNAKLYLMFGYDQSSAKYSIYHDLFGEPERPYPYNTLNVNRHGLHFGLNKKFEMNKFAIDIGINCAARTKLYKHFTATAQGGFNEPAPIYRNFIFETKPFFNDFGLEYSTNLIYNLFDKFSFNAGITYSRGHSMEYESSGTLIDFNGDVTTSQSKIYFEVNNFIYLNVGMTYKL